MPADGSSVKYDAFLSYSHAADQLLAQELQYALQQFGKRFYTIRALNIFRDQTDLSANPSLWPRIQSALDQARFFLLLASPRAARSMWVKREIDHWLSRHDGKPENLLILWTEGELSWDSPKGDFDWAASDALPRILDWKADDPTPRTLAGMFDEEPFYIDLRWTRTQPDLSLRDPRFLDHVATIAAELHGQPKRDLIGRDVTEHKRLRRWGQGLATALAVLTLASVLFAMRARTEQKEAKRQEGIAQTQAAIARTQEGIARTQQKEAVRQAGIARVNASEAQRQSGIAQTQKQEAQRQAGIALTRQHEAEAAAATALSRQLAAQSLETGARQLDLSLLLALAASNTADTQESRIALFEGLQRAGSVWSYLGSTPNRLFSAVAFSPDASLVIAANTDGLLFAFDPNSGRAVREPIAAHNGSIDAMAVDRTRSWLFTAGSDRKINIHRLSSLDRVDSVPTSATSIPALDVSLDGVWLAAGSSDVRLLNIEDRKWSDPFGERAGHFVQTLAFHPQSRILAFAYDDGEIVVWDRVAHGVVRSMRGHDTPYVRQVGSRVETRTDAGVESLAFSPDGAHLATGGYDGRVVIWDWMTGSQIASTSPRTTSVIGTVAFSPDGSTIYAGTWTGEMQAWKADSGSVASRAVSGHQGRIVGTAIAHGPRLVSVGWDGLLLLWDFRRWSVGSHYTSSDAVRAEPNVQRTRVRHVEILDRDTLITSSTMEPLVLWDVASGRSQMLAVEGPIEAFTIAGTSAAYIDARNRLMLLDLAHTNARPVEVADLGTNDMIEELRVSSSPDRLFVVTRQGPLIEVDLGQREIAPRNVTRVAGAEEVTLSGDGRRIVSRNDSEFLVSDVSTGRELLRKKVSSGRVALSSDGRLVAVNRYQFTDLWDTESGVLLHTFDHVERGVVPGLMFSPDDRILVSTGGSYRPMFWDVNTGFQTLQLRNPVTSGGIYVFSTDMRRFIEGHADGSVSVWDIDPQSWLRTACRIANRTLTSAERKRYGVPTTTASHVCVDAEVVQLTAAARRPTLSTSLTVLASQAEERPTSNAPKRREHATSNGVPFSSWKGGVRVGRAGGI